MDNGGFVMLVCMGSAGFGTERKMEGESARDSSGNPFFACVRGNVFHVRLAQSIEPPPPAEDRIQQKKIVTDSPTPTALGRGCGMLVILLFVARIKHLVKHKSHRYYRKVDDS